MTYKNLAQLDWLQTELESMSSAGDSLVKTSASQARAQDLPESAAASGTSSTGSSTKLSRTTRLLKTCQPFGLKDWTTYSGRSLRSGMTRSGTVYPLQPLALLTDATESGLWPTPRAQDSKHGAATDWELTTDHAGTVGSLRVQVVKRMWPTPAARDYRGANGYETTLDKIEQGRRAHLDQLPNAVQVVEGKAIRGTLNPTWVEWLMGFPLGWTDLKPSEMPSSRKYRKSSQGE